MHFMYVNVWAVLVAAVVTMVLGALWYSPVLFARPWIIAMGWDPDDKAKMDEMKKGAGPMYALAMLASILQAFVLAKIFFALRVDDPLRGVKIAVAVWLGFVATVQLTGVLFGKQRWAVFYINTGYQLVCYIAMGAILAIWR